MPKSSAHRSATATTTRMHDLLVVRIAGEVDLHSAEFLREEVRLAFDARPASMVLDLTGVTFFGADGLALLVDAHAGSRAGGTRLLVVASGRAVLMPMRATGVDQVVRVRATLAEAVASALPSR